MPDNAPGSDLASAVQSAEIVSGGPVASSTAVSAHFKMIFLAVFGLTTAMLLVRIGVAVTVVEPNDGVKDAMTTCGLLANAGFGAILGLSAVRRSTPACLRFSTPPAAPGHG